MCASCDAEAGVIPFRKKSFLFLKVLVRMFASGLKQHHATAFIFHHIFCLYKCWCGCFDQDSSNTHVADFLFQDIPNCLLSSLCWGLLVSAYKEDYICCFYGLGCVWVKLCCRRCLVWILRRCKFDSSDATRDMAVHVALFCFRLC